MKKKKTGYDWKFNTIGGVTRVNIATGKDIAHLGELDQKLWTVLSCPTTGLEFDEKTLKLLDKDGDGKIRVNEVTDTAKWLTSVLKDPEVLIAQTGELALDDFNAENEEGAKLQASAKQILANLGKEDSKVITCADASDSVAIFSKTKFNGDGIITPASTDDEELQGIINNAIATVGSSTDRSGAEGINADQLDAFYAACQDYADWKAAGTSDILAFGEDTAAALDACNAVKEKVADWFMRSKLASFDGDATGALDVSVAKIESISANNLAACANEIAEYPLARVDGSKELPLDGINPAWQAAMAKVKALVLTPETEKISEEEWNAILGKFAAYSAWAGAKKGAAVESLGLEAVQAVLEKNRKEELAALIAEDKKYEAEAGAIDTVDKLLRLKKDFYCFLKNFVTFTDFYNSYKGDIKAVFQAGTLYIEQRSCDLCIKVTDMGKHGDMAGLSGMYILYCSCTSKVNGKSFNIAAVLTDGDVDNLRVGQNCVFYDRDGMDYDAVITKIVDNPVSIRQAFWSPYKKVAKFLSDKMNKLAADKESAATADLTAKADGFKIPTTAEEAEAAKANGATPFDIAKFAGIFAAIGMALGFLLDALVQVFQGVASLSWWELIILIVGLMIVISGPAVAVAWLKIRKRNLAPVLNANGWAINSKVIVNATFGATFTNLAQLPKVAVGKDPFSGKTPCWKKVLRWFIVLAIILGIGAWVHYDKGIWPFEEEECTECVAEEAAEATEEAAAEVAEEAAAVEAEAPAEAPAEVPAE